MSATRAGRVGRGLLALAGALLGAAPAAACPVCGSEAGRRVRAGIFDHDFGGNLLLTALPFAVLLAVAAVIHFGPRRPTAGTRPSPAPGATP